MQDIQRMDSNLTLQMYRHHLRIVQDIPRMHSNRLRSKHHLHIVQDIQRMLSNRLRFRIRLLTDILCLRDNLIMQGVHLRTVIGLRLLITIGHHLRTGTLYLHKNLIYVRHKNLILEVSKNLILEVIKHRLLINIEVRSLTGTLYLHKNQT